ncbi:hypothetical protein NST99_03935 [Paenibacillus sp. FSL L8-0470]|uniref:hypothetical protein n=1 Tax=Paenibacillus sp. FSL L8-0470 TaxID=2954688 RepID=UPI0030F7BCDD
MLAEGGEGLSFHHHLLEYVNLQDGVNRMASIVQGLAYKAFGLQIHSEFPLPELPLSDQPGLIGSVSVIQEDLSERWQAIPKVTPSLVYQGTKLCLRPRTPLFSPFGTAVRLQCHLHQVRTATVYGSLFWEAAWAFC